MKSLLHVLGNLKVAIVLLVVILVAMAAGTIVESARGTETAQRAVYGALWFRVLLALFAVNILCSLADHFPWEGKRAGFVITHGSMLVILLGALVTEVFKIEGHLALWEGEESAVFADEGTSSLPLPFRVRLDAFEIDFYPGTMRPAMFRSRVTVTDPASGRAFPAVIQMNQELSYGGYRLFQSSYQRTPERDQTVLAVSRDPGQPIVFLGYGLLMAGMLTVLGTRIAQRRAAARGVPIAARGTPRRSAAAVVLIAAALAALAALAAAPRSALAASLPDGATVETLRRLPVQHDGRVMPLDTLAREAVWRVTGKCAWQGADPVALVLGWTFDPDGWADEPIVKIGPELAAAAGMPAGTGRASFHALAGNTKVLSLIAQARRLEQQEEPVHGVLKEARKAEDRLVWLQGFLSGTSIDAIPPPPGQPSPGEKSEGPVDAWSPPEHARDPRAYLALLEATPAGVPPPGAIAKEIVYNRVRPSRLAWMILAAATLVSLLSLVLARRWTDALAVLGLAAGSCVMTWGIATRWQVAGRIPASNMYESLLFLGWGVSLFALIALVVFRNRLVVFNATAMSALTMVLADLLPIDPFVHPVPPVLAGTVWLAIHVPIIMLSYSVLTLGMLVAHMQIGVEIFAPRRTELVWKLNDLLYWYIHVGAILLIAGILTGSIWAASSWGRYWGWDPKEVWSLVAFLAYLAILHGRLDRVIGPLGVAAASILAFWTILMTYVGVNFVLASGLHSYGFGSSGVVTAFLIVAVCEGAFLTLGLFAHALRRGQAGATEARA